MLIRELLRSNPLSENSGDTTAVFSRTRRANQIATKLELEGEVGALDMISGFVLPSHGLTIRCPTLEAFPAEFLPYAD